MFLKAAMQITNDRGDIRNNFSIGYHLQPQYTVRTGMLGANIQDHLVALYYSHPSFTFGTTIPWYVSWTS